MIWITLATSVAALAFAALALVQVRNLKGLLMATEPMQIAGLIQRLKENSARARQEADLAAKEITSAPPALPEGSAIVSADEITAISEADQTLAYVTTKLAVAREQGVS